MPSLIELRDARVPETVGDKDVAGVPSHVGRPIEDILLTSCPRCSATRAAFTAGRRAGMGMASGFRPSSKATRPCGSNLMTMSAHLIHDPDIVLRIDANLGGKHEPVDVPVRFPGRSFRCDRTRNSRDPPCAKEREPPNETVGWPVRV